MITVGLILAAAHSWVFFNPAPWTALKSRKEQFALWVQPESHLENSSSSSMLDHKTKAESTFIKCSYVMNHSRSALFCSGHFYEEKKDDLWTDCKMHVGH